MVVVNSCGLEQVLSRCFIKAALFLGSPSKNIIDSAPSEMELWKMQQSLSNPFSMQQIVIYQDTWEDCLQFVIKGPNANKRHLLISPKKKAMYHTQRQLFKDILKYFSFSENVHICLGQGHNENMCLHRNIHWIPALVSSKVPVHLAYMS